MPLLSTTFATIGSAVVGAIFADPDAATDVELFIIKRGRTAPDASSFVFAWDDDDADDADVDADDAKPDAFADPLG